MPGFVRGPKRGRFPGTLFSPKGISLASRPDCRLCIPGLAHESRSQNPFRRRSGSCLLPQPAPQPIENCRERCDRHSRSGTPVHSHAVTALTPWPRRFQQFNFDVFAGGVVLDRQTKPRWLPCHEPIEKLAPLEMQRPAILRLRYGVRKTRLLRITLLGTE